MVLVACGDFKPEEMLQEIKDRLIEKPKQGEIKRVYEIEQEPINMKYKETQMQVSKPIFMIGFKDKIVPKEERVKRHIAIEILANMLTGKSSELYQKLYQDGTIIGTLDSEYEFSDTYSHILISGQSTEPEKVKEELLKNIIKQKENFDVTYFERIKKKVYGDYVVEYNNVDDIARMFLSDYFKEINSLDYIEKYNEVTTEFTKKILEEVFDEKSCILSVVKPK